MRNIILQLIILLIAGAALGLAVNLVHPRGISPLASTHSPVTIELITLEQAAAFFESGDAIFVDARTPEEFAQLHIPGAVSLPLESLTSPEPPALDFLPHDALLIVYCDSEHCEDAQQLARILAIYGYAHLKVIQKGIDGWFNQGLPLEYSQ